MLLKSQRADLFTGIEKARLEPRAFELLEGAATPSFRRPASVTVRARSDEKVTFAIIRLVGHPGFHLRYSPGVESVEETASSDNWAGVLHHYSVWLEVVKQEMETGDPWAELERQAVDVNFVPEDDDKSATPFTVAEFERVGAALLSLQADMLRLAGDNEDAQERIETGVSKLIEDAKSQPRKAFFQSVVFFLLGTAVSLSLAPEQTRSLFERLKAGLSGIITLVQHSP